MRMFSTLAAFFCLVPRLLAAVSSLWVWGCYKCVNPEPGSPSEVEVHSDRIGSRGTVGSPPLCALGGLQPLSCCHILTISRLLERESSRYARMGVLGLGVDGMATSGDPGSRHVVGRPVRPSRADGSWSDGVARGCDWSTGGLVVVRPGGLAWHGLARLGLALRL